jgi:hypothetical protein
MSVGNRVFSGKGAGEEAAKALTSAIRSWKDAQTMQRRGQFRGFEISSKGRSGEFGLLEDNEPVPELFVRGRATYSANLNPTNPVGTVQSIEHTLRSMDKLEAEQQSRVARAEKELVDYQAQTDRPFEHEERLKELLARQSELNSKLDLDKGDQQVSEPVPEFDEAPRVSSTPDDVAKMAKVYMRGAGTAIREMPILEREPPNTGSITGRAVAKSELHIAVATAANRFIIVEASALAREVEIGETLSLLFSKGRPSIDIDRGLAR